MSKDGKKIFTIFSSLNKYMAKPFLGCSLKVLVEGAERGEGDNAHLLLLLLGCY